MILPAEGKSFDPAKIPGAVKDAGFSPGEIKITAVGRLASSEGTLRLEMAGALAFLVLDGGEAEQLSKQTGMAGQILRVDGTLRPSQAGQPPGMSVDRWTVASPPG